MVGLPAISQAGFQAIFTDMLHKLMAPATTLPNGMVRKSSRGGDKRQQHVRRRKARRSMYLLTLQALWGCADGQFGSLHVRASVPKAGRRC